MTTNATLSTLANWLAEATQTLKSAGIPTARLDCLVLLEDSLGKDRTHLLAHQELVLKSEQISLLKAQITRRASHEPLAYIRGKSEFYGREFMVSPDTLEPRPETETMIDLVKRLELPKSPKIADAGAGSGAIGITLALELPGSKVDMFEISSPAIKIAKQNLVKLEATGVSVHKNDLMLGVYKKYDVIVANLPYVPDSHTINQAALQEPKLAIFGGVDGLDIYRQLFSQLAKLRPKYILTESLPFQHSQLTKIAESADFQVQKTDDFIQLFSL